MKKKNQGAVGQRDPLSTLLPICVIAATVLTIVFITSYMMKLSADAQRVDSTLAMSSADMDITNEEQEASSIDNAEDASGEASVTDTAETSATQSAEAETSIDGAEDASAEASVTDTAESTTYGAHDISTLPIVDNPVDPDGADYQTLYPDMVVTPTEKTDDNTQKIVYLTFDDGPTENTEKILDVLEKYGVHATFFVSSQFDSKEQRAERLNLILNSGNTIGLHTYSHSYNKIYASVSAFLDDLHKIYLEVYEATGYQATLTRFPGGSVSGHNSKIAKELTAELTRRGFTYHDWAVSVGDAEGKGLSAKTIAKETVEACLKRTKSVVLFHDTTAQNATVAALPKIIEELTDAGYELRALDPSIRPFQMPLD